MNRHLHIIAAVMRKDLLTHRLLTALAVVLPLLRFLYDDAGENLPKALAPLPLFLMHVLAALVSGLLAAAVIQADSPASQRLDARTRPISAIDLIAAKALFLALTVFLPWLGSQTIFLSTDGGYPLAEALTAAFGQLSFVVMLLPLLALLCITATRFEALAVCALLGAYFIGVSWAGSRMPMSPAITAPGSAWFGDMLLSLLNFAACAVVLWLQYRKHRTGLARLTIVGVLALSAIPALVSIPGIQTPLAYAADTANARGVQVVSTDSCLVAEPLPAPRPVIDTVGGSLKADLAFNSNTGLLPSHWSGAERRAAGAAPTAMVASSDLVGLPASWRFSVDRVRATYVDAKGAVTLRPFGGAVYGQPPHPAGGARVASSWLAPRAKAVELQREPATLVLDYDMTLLRPDRTYQFALDGRRHYVSGFGWCGIASGVKQPGTTAGATTVDCLKLWPFPAKAVITYTGQPAKSRGPDTSVDHRPGLFQFPPVRRYRYDLPIDKSASTATVTTYRVAAGFSRRVETKDAPSVCPPPSADRPGWGLSVHKDADGKEITVIELPRATSPPPATP